MIDRPFDLTPENFIRSYERKELSELFDKSVTVLESKARLPKMEVEYLQEDVFYTIRERMIAAVLDKTDEAIAAAIMKAVDNGKIQTAYILDAEKIQKAFNKLKPEEPTSRAQSRYTVPTEGGDQPVQFFVRRFYCPDCGEWVYKNFHPNYCGVCGKAIKWKENDNG